MKTPREVLLNRHRDIEPKLAKMWETIAVRLPVASEEVRGQETGAQQEICGHGYYEAASRGLGFRQAQDDRSVGARPAVAPYQLLWRELILPSRRIWAGVACVWLVIGVLNLASSEPTTTEVANQAKPTSREEMRVLIEQRRMLAQLIGPLSEPAYTQKRAAPGPHSERAARTAAV